MPKRTFVCRCEDVTRADLDHAIELGMTDVEEIKRYTGLGTGPCQGKECLTALTAYLCARELAKPDDVQPFTPRPPAEPVTLGALAAASAGPEATE